MIENIRVALVTGAGSGIGKVVARTLAADGFATVLVGRRREPLEAVAAGIATEGGRALVAPGDVSKPADVEAIFAAVKDKFGRLDVLFNNAGVSAPGVPLEEITFEQWSAVVGANLTGAFLCTQAAFRLMKAQSPRGGRIISNGSVSCWAPRPFSAPYTSTKHAVTGLTKSTSLDGRAHDIACGQIDIGNAETEMAIYMKDGARQADGSMRVEALIDPKHVAEAVLSMACKPLDVNIPFITVMATKMPLVGRG